MGSHWPGRRHRPLMAQIVDHERGASDFNGASPLWPLIAEKLSRRGTLRKDLIAVI